MNTMIFQALFEHSSLGIIISNTEGVIEKSNPFASKIFGYGHGELNGLKVEALIPPHIRERHVTYREQYNKNPLPRAMGSSFNLMAQKKDGSLFPVEISLSYFEADGHRQIVSFINDITERKKVEDQLKTLTQDLEQKINERTKELSHALVELGHTNEGLEKEMDQRKKVEAQIRGTLEREKELNELKSRFVSMASHEFRTPLSGILTSVSLIAKYKEPGDEPKREKHIQTIKKSVKNLTNILNDFLSIDKLDQGKVHSSSVSFELKHLVDEIVEGLKDTSDKNHEFILSHINPNLTLFQDKDMLRNVLINLISNAIKYSPEGGKIEIVTKKLQSQVQIEIKDSGIGIPEADQKHLFERFFRAQNTSAIQGTGLGLNIVKRYLDLMDGDISFESQMNKGSTFKIILPLEKLNEKNITY